MKMKFWLFIILILSIFSISTAEKEIPNKNFNAREISLISSLPPETPTLAKQLIHSDGTKQKALESIKHLIGFLPISEQLVLLDNLDNEAVTVSKKLFKNYIEALKISDTNNFVTEQLNSLSEMLSANAKRFRAGLGCLKKVSNQFAILSNEDQKKLENINSNIEDMLHASNQLNHCEMNFLNVLFKTVNKKKAILTEITTDNYNKQDVTTDYFVYEEGLIKGIKYHSSDVGNLVREFKNYATCHQAFNNVIHRKGMETVISISQIKQCLDVENPNKRAGRSSNSFLNPSINVKGDQQIGINNATGIRTDKRTQNNYLLNKGYKFGQINVQFDEIYDSPILKIPFEWETKLKALQSNTMAELKTRTTSLFETAHIRPFADLHTFLLQTLNYNAEAYVNYVNTECTGSFQFECTSTSCTGNVPGSPFTTSPFTISKYTDFYTLTESTDKTGLYNYNFVMEEPYIAVICDNGKMQIYSEGTNPILGKVVELYDDGRSLGSDTSNVNQGCFGVFTSGGKNDKDTCRDTINKECGSELDYRCKESGLYDFITQNPPSKKVLPSDCTSATGDCLDWISKNFVLGTLSIKPSAFLSYSLNAQIEANKGTFTNPEYYSKADTIEFLDGELNNKFNDMTDYILEGSCYVEGNKPGVFSDIGNYQIEIDRTELIQISKGCFIMPTSFVFLLLFAFA